MKKIKWGILGAGVIANRFCDSLLLSEKSEIFSVASQTTPLNKERLESFKKKFQLKKENYFYSYDDLINLKDNDIIYIATTNDNHSFYSRIIAKNKKNILVEKPAALNSLDFKNDLKIVSDNTWSTIGEMGLKSSSPTFRRRPPTLLKYISFIFSSFIMFRSTRII